jgi:hypothetical protein
VAVKEDDPLADYVGPHTRRLSRQADRAVRRLSPEGRAALSGIPLRREDLVAAIGALSALRRGAGAAAVGAATAPFRSTGSDARVFLGREPGDRSWEEFERRGGCSFCHRTPGELRCQRISGPAVRICEDCLRSAAAALSALNADAQVHEAALGRKRCGFCGKGSGVKASFPGGGVRLLNGPRTAAICHRCVALCIAIIDHEWEGRGTRAEDLERWVRHLTSAEPFMRCMAAVALRNRGFANEPAARQALVAALTDTDWRVRALAEATLSNAGALPDGYHPSFVGRLRSLDFLRVFYAEQPSAIEGGAPDP